MASDTVAASGATAVAGLTQRLARNLAMQSGTQIMTLVLSVISVGVLTRELTVAAYGGFNYMLAVIYMGLTLADLGVTTILVREVAQAPERTEELIQSTLSLKLLMALVAMLGSWVLALVMLEGEVRWAVVIFSLVLPLQAMTLPHVVLRARVLIKRAVIPEVANRVTGFVCMVGAVYAGYGLVGAATGLIIGELAGLTAILWVTREFVRPIPRVDAGAWRIILRASMALGGVSILGALVNRLDYFMLERIGSFVDVGFYGAAYRLPNLLERFPLLVMGTLYPLMSRLAAQNPIELREVYRWTLVRAALVSVPVVAIVSYAAPWIIAAWNGPDYAAAVTPMRWLMVSTGCMYLSVVASNLLIALGRVHGSLSAWLVAAPVNALMNWWAIPRYGATGAAAATAVSFALAMIISLWMAERQLIRAIGAPAETAVS
jgi:O-antigen/teichoic acid export membrane protein